MKRILLFAAAFCAAAPAFASDHRQAVENLIKGYIQPEIRLFEEAATRLPDAVRAVCEGADDGTRADFKAAYSETVARFARIHFLRLGPLLEEDRVARLAFLPDPRAIGQRQLRKLLAAEDHGATQADTLADKSVAVQGLTALQLIAYDQNGAVILGAPDGTNGYSCRYAQAISGNVAAISRDLSGAWFDPQGYSSVLLETGGNGARYQSDQEALEAVFNVLSTGLIVARDQNVGPALGRSQDNVRPNRIPFSRSGNGLRFLRAELNGLDGALTSMKIETILPEEFVWLAGSAEFEFRNAQNILGRLTPPLRQTLQETQAYTQLSLVTISLNALERLVGQRIAQALGLAGGFNALDGD